MALQLYHPPPALDAVPPEIRLLIYNDLFHDPQPTPTKHDETPTSLQSLTSLRQTCELFAAELDFTEISELKNAFYADNTILFDRIQDLLDFAEHKPLSVLSKIQSVEVAEYISKMRSAKRYRQVYRAMEGLSYFPLLKSMRFFIGSNDSRLDPRVHPFNKWLPKPRPERPTNLLDVLGRYLRVRNRPVLELIQIFEAPDHLIEEGRDVSDYGKYGDVKRYQESAAGREDWKQIASPTGLTAYQAANRT